MRFWYRIGMSHKAEIKASIHSSNTTRQLWKSALHTEKWNFVQLPITTNATARVTIEGISSGTSIDFDDVSFSEQVCNEIPWIPHQELLPPLLPGCLDSLGMQNGQIPDSSITASSYYRARSAPRRARLHMALPDSVTGFTGGWCQYRRSFKYYEWLQVDFGFVASVGKVATQGKQEFDFWVTRYFIVYRRVATSGLYLYRQNGNVKIFEGNNDRHTVVSHFLIPRITAQFVRIYPYKYHEFGCLRVEYYGCAVDSDDDPQIPCYFPLGMQNGQIPNASITASSNFGSAYRARLYTVEENGKPGAWVATFADPGQWLQVDFGALVMVRGLASQGRHEVAQWVSSFVLSHSSVATNFRFYQLNQTVKIFPANNNQNTVAINAISPPILCRYLRVHPRSWVNEIALRIEIYGCLAVNMDIERIEDMGCYLDTPDRAIPLLEAIGPQLDGSYMQRAAAIRRCANAAHQLKIDVFAVQNGGQCFGGPEANLSYNKYGNSTRCANNGRGGPWSNQVFKINRRCSSSDEWCGWITHDNASTRWRLNLAEDLYRAESSIDTHWGLARGSSHDRRYVLETIGDERDVQITKSVTTIKKITELTLCYWLQDNNASLSLFYTSENNIASFSLQQNFTGLYFAVMETNILSTVSAKKKSWNHLCVSWSSGGGMWKIYQDGKLSDIGRWLARENIISGTGTIRISFRQINGSMFSRLSGVNIWNYELPLSDIYRLSLGCGGVTGNLLQWFDLRSEAESTGQVSELQGPSCTYRDAVMSIVSNSSEGEAVLESPWYNRSAQGYGRCLQFRFLMFGPGAEMLEIHQEISAMRRRIWKDSNNKIPYWRYGQVAFSSVARSKIIIKGKMERLPGYIAVGGLSWTDDYCEEEPPLASSQACNERLLKESGFIFSPYHPGLYAPNSYCSWVITAPVGHVVRLEVLYFQLEYDTRCKPDFLEVKDGPVSSAQPVGRFCGESVPSVFETSSNTMLITFRSDNSIQRSGFHLRYIFKEQTEEKICSSKRDCPSDCSCFMISDSPNKFAIQGYGLRIIPKSMPSYTTALLFANNRINQIQEKALSKLPLVEYIDLSHNVILVLAGNLFRDQLHLRNIKLTGNFIQKFTPTVFSGLETLEVLDLGENLLTKVPMGAFGELSSLRVLSLRSNEIKFLEEEIFSGRNHLTYL